MWKQQALGQFWIDQIFGIKADSSIQNDFKHRSDLIGVIGCPKSRFLDGRSRLLERGDRKRSCRTSEVNIA